MTSTTSTTSLSETPSPAALPTRPEARTFRVEDLVSSVLSGKIRIPAFQRGIKWDPRESRS